MKRKTWIVRAGEAGATVAEIVRRAGEDESAVGEGRVFRGRRRVARGDERVDLGDEISIGARRSTPDVEILFDHDGLVACVKPTGIPTVPDEGGAAHALVSLVAAKVGADDLRVTSRLDRDVSGVVVFARGAAAEERVKRARAQGTYARRYVALAAAPAAQKSDDRGRWTAPIGRGRDAKHRAVNGPDAKPSETRFRVVSRTNAGVLLAVDPVTGRTHQIRVHASHAGMPLLGDRDYGGITRITLDDGRTIAIDRVALHAARVTVLGLEARAPIPDALADLWSALGGAPEAWDTAIACDTASS